MKAGDLIRTTTELIQGGKLLAENSTGVVLATRYGGDLGATYVDVVLSVDGQSIYCGNYHEGFFEVINESR